MSDSTNCDPLPQNQSKVTSGVLQIKTATPWDYFAIEIKTCKKEKKKKTIAIKLLSFMAAILRKQP